MVGLKMAVLKRIRLVNFRSHERFELALDPQLTTIVGENGCGKTSVLEAIYEVTQGRSFRAVDREIVRRGAEFYRVELEYEDGRKVVAVYNAEAARKEFLVEDKRTRRLPKKARYPMVLFEPDDLGLIGSSPTRRRAYFDRMLGQLSEAYATALARYNKALKQRNELLKQEVMDAGEMFSWNMLLTQYGAELNRQRMGMTEQINRRLTEVYRSIAENEDEVEMRYRSEVRSEEEFLRELERGLGRDRILGHTGFGVHRDNYEFWFNGVEADGSASRGEVRSMVIALKFIEAEMVVAVLRQKPVVLLDDVFSELDERRQESLMTNFRDNQVVLTSVGEGRLG